MTLQRPKVQHATGRGDDPASTVAPSAAALAANDRLKAWRRETGINYRQPGAGDSRAWLANLAGSGDQAAASTVEADPGAGLDQDQGGRKADRVATVYPSLAAAFMACDLSAVGRLWVLLRAWDDHGRGFYDLDQVYQAFSGDGSPWRIGTRRRVQQLIKQGAGLFWTLRGRRGGRYHGLQLQGPAGVAAALGVGRLAGKPVGVPVADLLRGMHRANAALFSAALTLRGRGKGPRPVTRQTLAGMTGAAASTQRTYTRTATIETRPNFVTLPAGDVDGRGVFIYRGRVEGRPGRAILARRMPNSYAVALQPARRGRQRKINRRLNLVTSEARGYWPEVDYTRIYHDTAGQAAQAYGRNYHHDHYWPQGQTAAGAGLWRMVEAVNV